MRYKKWGTRSRFESKSILHFSIQIKYDGVVKISQVLLVEYLKLLMTQQNKGIYREEKIKTNH